MRGQSSSAYSISDTFNSRDSSMDQQFLWNSMLLNPVEVQGMQGYITLPGDRNLSYTNMGDHDSARLSIWSSDGPTYGHYSHNQGNHGETKVEHGRMSPLIIGSSSAPRTEERNSEVANMLSFENVNINHNISQFNGQLLPQNPNMHAVHQNPEYVADQVGVSNVVTASSITPLPYVLDMLDSDPSSIGSSNPFGPHGASSTSTGSEQEDDEMPGSLIDQRTACKRKVIEGLHRQTSGTASTSSYHHGQNNLQHSTSYSHNPSIYLNTRSTMDLPSVANPTEYYSPGYGPGSRRMFLDSYHIANLASNVESSHRNYRMRTNQEQLHGISASNSSLVNASRRSNPWSLNQPSVRSIPMNHSSEPTSVFATSTSQGLPHIPVGPGVPQAVYPMHWNGAPSLHYYNIEDGLIVRREEANTRNMPVNNILVPTADIRQMVPEPASWTLASRDISIAPPSTSRASTSSGLHPSLGFTWGINFPLQHPSQSLASQELSRRARAAPRSSHPAPHIRSAYMTDRQNDAILGTPLPLSMAVSREVSRETRHRIMIEVHHAMDDALHHRGDFRYETAALASANLHDRHRDMRLDVDNMSYEELLALGEHIGNVSTGLSEKKISKFLKQRKFVAVASVESMEIEPCCICQEEYLNGEELGTLDCGHDFHSACIRQWLVLKNICPICKNTALVT